jgi:ubiquinone/menaquinone biosynthesis C-methylase UbiE
VWNTPYRRSAERLAAVEDALDRGNAGSGTALELGSGTGTGTKLLAARGFASIIALDLAEEMLAIASPEFGARVRGDASSLPVASDSVDVVVLVNAMLFPVEVDRVLRTGGHVIWVNTLGDQTPIHLPPDDVVEALPGKWMGVASRAGTGIWAVVHRV